MRSDLHAVEFADAPRVGSLELVRLRGTALVLYLQRVLVRPGDKSRRAHVLQCSRTLLSTIAVSSNASFFSFGMR